MLLVDGFDDDVMVSVCRDCGGIDGVHSPRCLDIRDRREEREDNLTDFFRGDNDAANWGMT